MPITVPRYGTAAAPHLTAAERDRLGCEILRAYLRAHPEALPRREENEERRKGNV